jgi:para-nitrobenzyl esterase
MHMDPIVETTSGRLCGQYRDGVRSFLGIPYAASPTGALRFREPVPRRPWTGVRAATSFGPTPPKPRYPAPIDPLLPEPSLPGDDWLNLNVWAPGEGGSGLPVMTWIHGGGFSNGCSAVPVYDGHSFARDGVVLVSVNYRLGVDGFGWLPDAPGNRGLLDQIAALEWVIDNIAAFGGDPGNVTVFGESAGAMSVTTLLAAPPAQGLFAKAITQSGATQAAADPADAALVTDELAAVLGVPATAAALAGVAIEALIAAQIQVRDALAAHPDPARFGRSVVAAALPFIPVVDGDLLPAHPLQSIRDGAGAAIPLLTGTTTEEFRLFLVPTGRGALITEEVLPFIVSALGGTPAVLAAYRANRPGASPGEVLAAIVTDRYFRLPVLEVAAARADGPAPTFGYEFAWPSPVGGLGACHALDIPFVFDNLSDPGARALTGPGAPQQLADQMHAAWIAFATGGQPGWPAMGKDTIIRVFDGDGGCVCRDPRGDERRAWAAR